MTLEPLLKNDCYQVFLFTCPPSLPLSFASHPWFIINKKGAVSRIDVLSEPKKYAAQKCWGHFCIDALLPTQGLRILYHDDRYRWKTKLRGMIEGGEDSLAQKMLEVIERSSQTYPHCDRYAYTGPNSNTYAQWVIDQFPESGLTLPWNAFGKYFT